jgi:hypothetical protein
MEQVNAIELNDENVYPDDNVLKTVLGKSYSLYTDLLALYDKNEMTYDWRYYKDGKAWLCKVQKKNRTIVWMSAWKGYMKATIYFPEKYMNDLQNLDIPTERKQVIMETTNVGKSKPCMFEIKNKGIIKEFEVVMLYKLSTK